MVLNSATLFLALTLGGSTAAIGQAAGDSVTRDSVRIVAQDSIRPLAIRTLARAGIGAEPAVRVHREPDDSVIDTSGVTQRRHAVEYSDWYYKRLTIHKVASYTTIPLFVTEYILGDKLYNGTASSSTRSAHQAVATGIGVLFGVNTITGGWNLWESRHESQGRARRLTHGLLMLASDAGFVATAALAPEGNEGFEEGFEDSSNNRSTHRTVAVTSMGVSVVSYLMMYFWK